MRHLEVQPEALPSEACTMRISVGLLFLYLFLFAPGTVTADTLELVDGTLVEGRYVTSNEDYFIF